MEHVSIQPANIPSNCKQAKIIPIPKAGKPRYLGTIYQPISLLCYAIKVLKSLLLSYLNLHVNLSDTQHGYRNQKCTTSTLLPRANKVTTGFTNHEPLPCA